MTCWPCFALGLAGGGFGLLAWTYHREDDRDAAIGAMAVAVVLLTIGLLAETTL